MNQPLVQAKTERMDAYMLMLRGYFHLEKHTPEDLDRADSCFTKAFGVDNRLVRAYVGHALTSLSRSVGIDVLPPSVAYPIARDSARRALELDASDGRALAVLGLVRMWFEWDWTGAQACFEKAVSLSPGDHYVRSTFSLFHLWKGRPSDAIEMARSALPLDPLNLVSLAVLGVHFLYARRFNEAIHQLHAVLELEPDFFLAHMWLGDVYASTGRFAECLHAYQNLVSQGGRTPYTLNRLGMAYGLSGDGERAMGILRELEEAAATGYVHPVYLANVLFGLGRHEQAMDWMKKAYEQKDPFFLTVRFAPWLDSLRDDMTEAGLLD
jgi:tetratricopeptide (TPR) repeat protein